MRSKPKVKVPLTWEGSQNGNFDFMGSGVEVWGLGAVVWGFWAEGLRGWGGWGFGAERLRGWGGWGAWGWGVNVFAKSNLWLSYPRGLTSPLILVICDMMWCDKLFLIIYNFIFIWWRRHQHKSILKFFFIAYFNKYVLGLCF